MTRRRDTPLVLVVAESRGTGTRAADRLADVDGCRIETASPRHAASTLPNVDAVVVVGDDQGAGTELVEAAGPDVPVATVGADGRVAGGPVESDRDDWLGDVVERLARLARYDDQQRRAFDAARRTGGGGPVPGGGEPTGDGDGVDTEPGPDPATAAPADAPAEDLRPCLEPAEYEALFREFDVEQGASNAA